MTDIGTTRRATPIGADVSTPTPAPRFKWGVPALLVLMFTVGVTWGRWGADGISDGAVRLFQAIADAQYALYQARENVTASGKAEYAVLLSKDEGTGALERFLEKRPAWQWRDSIVPGWIVVGVPADDRSAIMVLREQDFARVVMRNRGLWICH